MILHPLKLIKGVHKYKEQRNAAKTEDFPYNIWPHLPQVPVMIIE